MDGVAVRHGSIESRTSWAVAILVVALLTLTYGAQLIVVVALKPIAESLDVPRAIPSLAAALVWLGTGSGGIAMGVFADRVGVRWTVSIGTLMTGLGLLLSASGSDWALLIGHGLFMGLLGGAGIVPPLIVYVSRWFDRRRGTALALVSSGNYIAGFLWPWLFQLSVGRIGWQQTMLAFAALLTVLGVPAAFFCLRLQPPSPSAAAAAAAGPGAGTRVLGLRPNAAMAVLALAPFFCCVPMAMPTAHLVAMCSDIGLSSGTGALMLSMLLGIAFFTQQFWGWVGDRLGGVGTVLLGSAAQAVSILVYAQFPSASGVVTGSVIYGLGFAGIVPAYVLAIRDLYPSREAGWRVPIMLLSGMSGMAVGSWLAGAIFDRTGHYALAFQIGFLCNLINLAIVGLLVLRHGGLRVRPAFG